MLSLPKPETRHGEDTHYEPRGDRKACVLFAGEEDDRRQRERGKE